MHALFPSCEFQLARMEENHERKRRARIPRHRRLLREFRGGSRAKAGSQPMLGFGIIAVDPALGRDLGDCLRNNFGLVFLTFGPISQWRHPPMSAFKEVLEWQDRAEQVRQVAGHLTDPVAKQAMLPGREGV